MTQTPKNILITHVYSSANKGDAALTSVLIADLRRRFGRVKLHIVSLQPNGRFESVPESPAFMHFVLSGAHAAFLKLLRACYMLPATLLWALCRRYFGVQLYLPKSLRLTAELYATADLIVAVGGGYLRSRTGLANRLNVVLLLHPLLLGYLLGKPTVLYSQSIGPFVHHYEGSLAAWVLKRMALILVREDTSRQLLAKLGVQQNVQRAIDSGFLLRSRSQLDLRKKFRIPAGRLLIGVTVRSWLQAEAQAKYEQAVAAALDDIAEQYGAYVLFIPQVTAAKGDDDRQASRRVYQLMRHQAVARVIMDEPDHHHIKAIYDGLDLLLGTRFHSVIFSLTSFVPVVAIEYEHKTSGIMRDLKLENWVIKIEDVTKTNLTNLLERLVRDQSTYRAHLRQHLPAYVERASQTIELLATAIRSI